MFERDKHPADQIGSPSGVPLVAVPQRNVLSTRWRSRWILLAILLAGAVVVVVIYLAPNGHNTSGNPSIAQRHLERTGYLAEQENSHSESDSVDRIENDSSESATGTGEPEVNRLGQVLTAAAIPGLSNRETLHSVAGQVRFVTPGSDDWSTEALGAEALRQLNAIGQLISRADVQASHPPADLLDGQFECRPLRSTVEVVFRDGSLEVRRAIDTPTGGEARRGVSRFQGVARLQEAIRELTESLVGAHDIHVKFKVIRVRESDDTVDTGAYYQLSAKTAAGAIQQNATWQCRWRKAAGKSTLRLKSIDVEDYSEIVAHSDQGWFVDCTEFVLSGNPFYREQFLHGTDYWQSRLDGSFGIDVAGLEGLAIGDVNGDGLEDVYVCQTGGLPNRLFVQNADGTATDRARSAGVDWQELSRSALLIDLDNDGDQDLVLAMRYKVLFLANDGNGHFSLKSSWANTADLFSMAAADYDGDGDLDVYVCARNDTNSPFRHGTLGTPIPYHDANNGAANALLENRGNWQFVDVTRQVGLDANNRRFSYAATWDDYDNDGDQDLYVANDHGRNNLYENRKGKFQDVAPDRGVQDMAAGMSASWGDFNRDGWMDMYVSNMFSSAGGRITYQRRFHDDASDQTKSQYQRHTRGNTLFASDGEGGFRDVSVAADVTMGRWAWGSIFFDMNNDGWQDIYVTNGFVTGPSTDDL